MSSRVRLIIVAAVLVFSSVLSADDDTIKLTLKSSFQTGIIGKSELEIGAYHSATRKLFVVAGERPVIRILDISRPDAPALIREVDVSALGSAANSIAISGDLVAAAIEGRVKTDPGKAAFSPCRVVFLKMSPSVLYQI